MLARLLLYQRALNVRLACDLPYHLYVPEPSGSDPNHPLCLKNARQPIEERSALEEMDALAEQHNFVLSLLADFHLRVHTPYLLIELEA